MSWTLYEKQRLWTNTRHCTGIFFHSDTLETQALSECFDRLIGSFKKVEPKNVYNSSDIHGNSHKKMYHGTCLCTVVHWQCTLLWYIFLWEFYTLQACVLSYECYIPLSLILDWWRTLYFAIGETHYCQVEDLIMLLKTSICM